MREWFWQIEELRQGPDYVFLATFAPHQAQRLAQLVRQHVPPGFVPNTNFINPQRRDPCMVYASYLDQHTHERLVAMRANQTVENVYYSGEIEVRDHQLVIANILAGGPYGETPLLIALAQAPDLTLQEWVVGYNGYAWGEVARGNNAASLLTYLHAEG